MKLLLKTLCITFFVMMMLFAMCSVFYAFPKAPMYTVLSTVAFIVTTILYLIGSCIQDKFDEIDDSIEEHLGY